MMLEPMTIWVEVWPVAADEDGLWLASGTDAWREGPVMADSSVDWDVKMLLGGHGITADDLLMLHSTSWRPEGPRQIDTYVAALVCDGPALERWPRARPITPGIYDDPSVGPPPTHGAAEEPVPRFLDVLYHGLGHFRQQMRANATHRDALGERWQAALGPFEETLAGMYSTPHRAA